MQVSLVYLLVVVGFWGPEVITAEVTCDPPPSFERTVLAGADEREEYPLGTNVTYRCDFGYVSEVVIASSRCTLSKDSRTANWTELNIRCKPRSCGDPGFVYNAERVGSLFTFPNSVRYQCEEGYEIHGLATRYCLASGSWSGALPTCEKVHCNPPADPENGQAIYSSTVYESELKYRCNEGYRLSIRQSRICRANGTWSGVDPLCSEGLCEPPVAPEKGLIVLMPSIPRIGSIVAYSCQENFRLDGSETSRCLETGEWTFPTPKCLHPCKIPQVVPHGKIGVHKTTGYGSRRRQIFDSISGGTRVEDGEFILKCDNNYEVIGSEGTEGKVECKGGSWSDNLQCVPASCRNPPPSTSNGHVSKLNKEHGGTVYYACNSDYLKTKTGNVTCNFGRWIGITPVCTDTRCYVEKLSFPGLKQSRKVTYKSGESFLPSCVKGYKVAKPEASRLSCQQGKWFGHMPPCTGERCGEPPPSLPNGRIIDFTGEHASMVRYECNEHYILHQSSQVQCLFGEWKGRVPECKDSRCYLKDLRKTLGVSVASNEVTKSGDHLYVVCDHGYSRTGLQPLCTEGNWRERVLSPCRERSCEVTQVHSGALTERHFSEKEWKWSEFRRVRQEIFTEIPIGTDVASGDERYLRCFNGYSVQGSGAPIVPITCLKGKWQPHPVCLITGTKYVEVEEKDIALSARKPAIQVTVAVTDVSSNDPNLLQLTSTITQPSTSFSTDGREVDELHVVDITESNKVSEVCSCEYNSPDDNLVAYAGNELVQNGNKVKFNCTVMFHCKEVGYYHLMGPKEMTCTDCQPFHSSAYPTCSEPKYGDTVIVFDNNLKVMPGGILLLQQGVTVRITCLGSINYPVWTVPHLGNVKVTYGESQDGKTLYSLLDIKHPSSENDGKHSCSIQRYRPNVIDIKVFDPEMRCPLLDEGNKFIIEYDKNRTLNSTAKFSCKKLGQKITGADVLTCLINGHWSDGIPDCTDIKCPAFREPENMLLEYTSEQRFGSVANFYCEPTGVLAGSSRCLETGNWSMPMPSCPNEEVLCPRLEEREFRVVYDGERRIASKATISCKYAGQKLNGSEVLRCLENGHWSDEPECVDIKCPTFEETEDMDIQYTSERRIGSAANFYCFSPGILSGKSNIKCLPNGQWSGEKPSCSRPPCPLESLFLWLPEGIVPNVEKFTDAVPYGTSLGLTCENDLRIEGIAAVKCGKEEKWEIPRVRCVAGCGPILKADSSQLIVEPEKDFYLFGEAAKFLCPTGQTLTSDLELVRCLRNGWSDDEIPDCKDA